MGFISGFYIQSNIVGYSNMYKQYFKHILDNNYKVYSKEIIISEYIKGNIINGIEIVTGKKYYHKM